MDREDMGRWNWGAFFIPFLWLWFNASWFWAVLYWVSGMFLKVLPFSFLIYLGISVYLGINGHKIAWEHHQRSLGSIAELNKQQKGWAIGAFILVAISLIFGISAGILSKL